jgi:hypothetical protein
VSERTFSQIPRYPSCERPGTIHRGSGTDFLGEREADTLRNISPSDTDSVHRRNELRRESSGFHAAIDPGSNILIALVSDAPCAPPLLFRNQARNALATLRTDKTLSEETRAFYWDRISTYCKHIAKQVLMFSQRYSVTEICIGTRSIPPKRFQTLTAEKKRALQENSPDLYITFLLAEKMLEVFENKGITLLFVDEKGTTKCGFPDVPMLHDLSPQDRLRFRAAAGKDISAALVIGGRFYGKEFREAALNNLMQHIFKNPATAKNPYNRHWEQRLPFPVIELPPKKSPPQQSEQGNVAFERC